MIDADTTLATFMESASGAIRVDLYTITLANGTVLHWTNTNGPVAVPGIGTFSAGPLLERSRLTAVAGIAVDELYLKISPHPTDLIGGVPLMQLAMLGGLRGCTVKLQWGYFTKDPVPVFKGVMDKFEGQGSPIDIEGVEIELLARSELERLLIMMPRDVYQASCLNTVYDAGCGASRAAFTVTGACTSVVAGARSAFTSARGEAAGYFDLGSLRFTSGPNTGVRRTVRSFAGGAFSFALPFPFAISVGDAFETWPGCNGAQATCSAKFANLPRFRGQPYIPVAEVTT